ncbi:MAG: phosphoribosyltransferase family protein [Candidatus Magasanikiibacteriota bacterium]
MKVKKSQKIIKAFTNTDGLYTIGPKMTTNGRLAPIYTDIRKFFSFPKNLKLLAREIINFTKEKNIDYDIVLGGATAGIPIATAVSLLSGKQFGYVRKAPKDGGNGLAVEGNYKKGMKCILIDDAMGHGDAKIAFIKNIREAGLKVEWVIVAAARVLKGEIGKKSTSWIKPNKVKFQAFCEIYDLIKDAYENKIITKEAFDLLSWYADDAMNWPKDPKKWEYFQNYLKKPVHHSKSGV